MTKTYEVIYEVKEKPEIKVVDTDVKEQIIGYQNYKGKIIYEIASLQTEKAQNIAINIKIDEEVSEKEAELAELEILQPEIDALKSVEDEEEEIIK